MRRSRHFINQYSYDERRYFNTAAGIRATDKNHLVAQRYFERMKSLETEKGGIKTLAHEGFETAEQARALVAQMLGCKPRNILFGNSSSMVAMLAIRAIYEELGKENVKLVCHSDYQYPTVVLAPFLSWKKVKSILTKQNYGVVPVDHSILTSEDLHRTMLAGMSGLDMRNVNLDSNFWQYQSEVKRLSRERENGGLIGEDHIQFVADGLMGDEIEELQDLIAHSSLITLSTYKKALDASRVLYGQDPFLYHTILGILDRVDRSNGELAGKEALEEFDDASEFRIELDIDLILMVDGSHSFSIVDFDQSRFPTQAQQLEPFTPVGNCDVYIANSSKGLGAEPTVGIMYVSDKLLQVIEKPLPTIYPRVAFQFSPETTWGMKPDEVERTKYWLSLPELVSLKVALEERMKFGFGKAINELQVVRDKLMHGLSAINHHGFSILSNQPNSLPRLWNIWNDLGFDSYGTRTTQDANYIPNYIILSTGDISSVTFDPKRVRILLEKKGYAIASSDSVPTLFGKKKGTGALSPYLRISFRPGIEYDVDGFLEALNSVLTQLKKEQHSAKPKKKDTPSSNSDLVPEDDFPF